MNIQSKKLWQYLSDKGLLNGSESDMAKGKADYRRMYQREWKKHHKLPYKEIRLKLNIREYMDLKVKAIEAGFNSTKYIKELALVSIETKQIARNPETLKKILQLIKMAATTSNGYKQLLQEAEKLLLEYLKK